ncbi:MAG: hypothetical protein PHG34_07530 [Candidatus Cloacimonetes bacterium]|jgi:Tfp pilus assembly protein PilN|nr:hypothetical protein [Candidatus Cloacimonadota bacterium]MDY0326291.1 hypothetical protein [Candidatus Cloacimonadaceae bacterium]
MKKIPRTVFAFTEDGNCIKLGQLVRELDLVFLMDLQKIELDSPLYLPDRHLDDSDPLSNSSFDSPGGNKDDQDEFETQFSNDTKTSHWDHVFRSQFLNKGVIAINVNEGQIVCTTEIPDTTKAVNSFVRSQMNSRQFKSGEWQTSRLNFGGILQLWLHKGANPLLGLIKFHAKNNHKRAYFQLADANDIALADYYRIHYLDKSKRVLLVYLGAEYRKAFLFSDGELVDVYALNISEDRPEPELILSRITLALDSVQQSEPEETVICGDLASQALVNYFEQKGPGHTSLLTHPSMIIDFGKTGAYDDIYLAQFTLPIALAYKALFPDDPRFSPSNFIPKYILEAQKPLKIVWHGFVLAFILFCVTLLGTINYLSLNDKYVEAAEQKRTLDYQQTVLQTSTKELSQMRAEMAQFGQNMDALRLALKGKNPWSQVLETLNRVFQAKPLSWLSNFKMAGSRLIINGITSNRAYVIDFANALPESRIHNVINKKLKGKTVWEFEISSDLPDVDWVGQIEAETAEILEKARLEAARFAAEEQKSQAQEMAVPPAEKNSGSTATKQTAATTAAKLPPIAAKNMPTLSEWQNKASGNAKTDYDAFMTAVKSGSLGQCKILGNRYIVNHSGGRLEPTVRWHLANQLYLNQDYLPALDLLDPLVHRMDAHYPYALLLSARIDVARNNKRKLRLYDDLMQHYPTHAVRAQVDADLAILRKGGDR